MGQTSFENAQYWLTFPLFEAWGTWNEVEIYDTKKDQHMLKEKIEKERIEKEEI